MLFTLIAERYERRSLGITSNLVFSEWEKVFANPMATAAAIDRIVHHSVILEFDTTRPSRLTSRLTYQKVSDNIQVRSAELPDQRSTGATGSRKTTTNDNYTGPRAAKVIGAKRALPQ